MADYCRRAPAEGASCFDYTDEEGRNFAPLPDFAEALAALRGAVRPFLDSLAPDGPQAGTPAGFALNSPGENAEAFMKRLNKAARDAGEDRPETPSGSERWLIGSNSRDIGSVHSDMLEDAAANIASRNLIGVYPVIGWWRERAWSGRYDRKARYSLIVSLHTPDENVDIYTPVAVQVGTLVEVPL